ncbi:CHAT domain-containing protein [Streptomyces sp. ST2-7A]|uniref:CHAT domain-containing protein n=1 Tax=Streptomyces sp. ST2-7A TaxID=2907214 RepID=UPI001F34AC71|nr:CHAT domain-containing protein [Streptomyces sp. ST2-7A]MCE7079072.1 CHAT domain-containing protein [Streptomyces sp. ST2-7A]
MPVENATGDTPEGTSGDAPGHVRTPDPVGDKDFRHDRELLVRAVRRRLRRTRAEADHAPVLERGTRREADRLASFLNASPDPVAEPDGGGELIEAHYVLGWVRWLRADGIRFRRRAAERERRAALDALLPCYLWAPKDPEYVRRLPSGALSALAERAVPVLAERVFDAPAPAGAATGAGATDTASDAIALWRRVLRDLPEDHRERARALTHLSRWLLRRHAEGGSPAEGPGPESSDPIEALHIARLAAAAADRAPGESRRGAARVPTDTPDARSSRRAATSVLAAALISVGTCSPGTDTSRVDEAILLLEGPDGIPAAGEPVTAAGAEALALLGLAFRVRWERVGDERAAERAVECARRSVCAPAGEDPRRPDHLRALAVALRLRYERTGELAALEAAVEAQALAVDTTPVGDRSSAARLDGLGALVQVRYRRTGAAEDTERAVESARRAVAASRSGDRVRAVALSNLATALCLRHERGRDPNALNDAVAALEEAIALLPTEHPLRPVLSGNLGAVLRDRHAHVGSEGDLERAVNMLLDACVGVPPGRNAPGAPAPAPAPDEEGPGEPDGLRQGRRNDTDGAPGSVIPSPEGVVATAVPRWADLGRALARRHELTGAVDDRRAAADALAVVAAAETARPSLRVESARRAAGLLEPIDPTAAAAMAARAVELLPLMISDGSRASHRPGRAPAPGPSGSPAEPGEEAASLAVADPAGGSTVERARRALSLVEAGRPVAPGPLPDAVVDPPPVTGTADHAVSAGWVAGERTDREAAVGTPAATGGPSPAAPPGGARAARRRLETVPVTGEGPITLLEHAEHLPARARDARLAVAGTLIGPARLPDPDRLLAAADRGPVVTLVAGRRHGDALVAVDGTVRRVELPSLTRNAVGATVDTLRDALVLAREAGVPASRRPAAEDEVDAVLRWLWDAVAGPVLSALGSRGPVRAGTGASGDLPPRLWWVPGGALAHLPLHAAGHHDDPPGAPGRRVLADRVVSSTVPSIRSLLLARERAAVPPPGVGTDGKGMGEPARGHVVAVGDRGVLGGRRPASREVMAVRGLLPGAPVLGGPGTDDPPGDPRTAARSLRGATVAHLVTGTGGEEHRFDGPGPRLAYLSAYGPPPGPIDGEVVAPPPTVALYLAGVPSVVGPLWPWADAGGDAAGDGSPREGGHSSATTSGEFAVELAREFHLRLRRARAGGNGEVFPDTARVLHAAVRAARRTTGAGPSLWAAPHHVGA